MLGLREPVALVAGGGQFRQDLVEIVAAQRRDAFGGERAMRFLADLHQRRVERSAAQIVNQNHAVDFVLVAEFNARGRRLVQQPDHVASGRAERLHREKALVGVGVGGNAQHHFQLFLRQQIAQRGGHFAQHLNERHLLIGQLQDGVGSGILQHAFERPDDGPLRILLARPSLPSVDGARRREPRPEKETSPRARRPALRTKAADNFRDPRPPPPCAWCRNQFPVSPADQILVPKLCLPSRL